MLWLLIMRAKGQSLVAATTWSYRDVPLRGSVPAVRFRRQWNETSQCIGSSCAKLRLIIAAIRNTKARVREFGKIPARHSARERQPSGRDPREEMNTARGLSCDGVCTGPVSQCPSEVRRRLHQIGQQSGGLAIGLETHPGGRIHSPVRWFSCSASPMTCPSTRSA